jgi:hypothetical protein
VKKSLLLANVHLGVSKVFFFAGPYCIKSAINFLNQPAMIMYSPYLFLGYGICRILLLIYLGYSAYVVFEGFRNV